MPSLGIYINCSIYPTATSFALTSLIQQYPNIPIAICLDGNAEIPVYDKLVQQFQPNIKSYEIGTKIIGYPKQPYGYKKDDLIVWWDRLYNGVKRLNTDFVSMWEDDCVCIDQININPEWKIAGHLINQQHGNNFHPLLQDIIINFCGIMPNVNFYSAGGGTIFHRDTFLNQVYPIGQRFLYDPNLFDQIQTNWYPTIGWLDCFLTVAFLLTGYPYDMNPFLYDIHSNYKKTFDLPNFLQYNKKNNLHYSIIHGYKKYY